MNNKGTKRAVGLGAGGHAKVVIEILRLTGFCDIVGLLDPKKELWGAKVLDVPVLGGDDLLPELSAQGVHHAFIGVGSVGDSQPRIRLYENALEHGFDIVSAVHPQAVVSPSAKLGRGVTIMACAVVNAQAQLGDNVIVNTGAVVEHDCIIGDHVHIATGARLAGGVRVGNRSHIGAGATVLQGIRIGEDALVGVGAVAVRDVAPGVTVFGSLARVLKSKGGRK